MLRLSALVIAVLSVAFSSCAASRAKAPESVSGGESVRAGQGEFERRLFAELNRLRLDPKSFLPDLRERLTRFEGKRLRLAPRVVLVTREGPAAVEEAMAFLQGASELPPLAASAALDRAARLHVDDLGPRGGTGHEGSGGSTPGERMQRFAELEKVSAENLAFGDSDPRGVVLQLLIDDGVPDRGHRRNMFNPRFRVVGVACGPHKVYGRMCVMDFAGGAKERR